MNYDDLVRKLEELYVRDGTNYVQWAAKAIQELQRDVLRYRWLRDESDWWEDGIVALGGDNDFERLAGTELDAAIDKAMEQSHE